MKRTFTFLLIVLLIAVSGYFVLTAQDENLQRTAMKRLITRLDDLEKNQTTERQSEKFNAAPIFGEMQNAPKSERSTPERISIFEQQMDRLRLAGKNESEIESILKKNLVAGSGAISGALFQEDGISPLGSSGNVNVYDAYGYYIGSDYYSFSDTSYLVDGLPPGDYYVKVRSYGDYLEEYYNDAPGWRDAELVTVSGADTTKNIDFLLRRGTLVGGVIYEAAGNTPLANHDLQIELYDDTNQTQWPLKSFWLRTNADGQFYTMGVAPGSYKIAAIVSGYFREYYDGALDWESATILQISAGTDTLPGIDFYLDTFAANQDGYEQNNTMEAAHPVNIGDTVKAGINPVGDTDFYSFEGQAGDTITIDIDAISIGSSLYASLTLYDSTGGWLRENWGYNGPDPTIKNFILLYTGKYFVKVASSGGGGDDFYYHMKIFKDNKGSGVVTGDIFQEDGSTPYFGDFNIHLIDPAVGFSVFTAYIYSASSYTLSDVPDGSYLVKIEPKDGMHTVQFYDGVYSATEAQTVQVSAPDTTKDIDFILKKGGAIGGQLYENDGATPFNGRARIVAVNALDNNEYAGEWINKGDSGRYVIDPLPPGNFKVNSYVDDMQSYFMKTWYDGALSVNEATPVAVAVGETAQVDITYQLGGKIRGFVYEADGVTRASSDDYWLQVAVYNAGSGEFLANTFNTFSGGYRTSPLPGTSNSLKTLTNIDGYKIVPLVLYSNIAPNYYNGGATFDDANTQTISLTPGTSVDADLSLATADGVVSGVVYDQAGNPLDMGIDVFAYDESGHIVQATWVGVDMVTGEKLPRGHYKIYGLREGTYYIMAWFWENMNLLVWYPNVVPRSLDKFYFQKIPAAATAVIVTQTLLTTGINIYANFTGIENPGDVNLPDKFELHQNFPNPFNPVTQIRFGIPERSPVKISIYDINGRLIKMLLDKPQSAGWHQLQWDGRNSQGRTVSTGVYFVQIVAGDYTDIKKMVLIR